MLEEKFGNPQACEALPSRRWQPVCRARMAVDVVGWCRRAPQRDPRGRRERTGAADGDGMRFRPVRWSGRGAAECQAVQQPQCCQARPELNQVFEKSTRSPNLAR